MAFPHRITIQRLTNSNNQFIYTTLATNVEAFVQPIDNDSSEQLNSQFAKSSFAYVPFSTDIGQNDRIIFKTVTYNVKGEKPYDYGNLTHKKVLIEQL